MVSDVNMSHGKMFDFVSFLLFGFTVVIKLTNFDLISHWNTLIFFDKEVWCQIWICPMEKRLILLFHFHCWVNFHHKAEKLRFWKSHWNTLISFDKKDMVWDLNMSHGKMSNFIISFPLFGFTLVIKLRNLDFEKAIEIL